MGNLSGSTVFDAKLDRFQEEQSSARRFHAETIGHDVDPSHCLADFFCRVRAGDLAGIAKNYWPEVAKGTAVNLKEIQGTEGGYLLPQEFSNNCLRDISTKSLVRRLGAYVHPMTTESVTLSVMDVSRGQAAGIAPYFGGAYFNWLSEDFPPDGFQKTAQPAFRDLELTAKPLGGYLYASNSLSNDTPGFESWISRILSWGLAWYQDYAFFQGNGAGRPMGIVNAPGSIAYNRGAGGPKAADVQGMIAKMLPSAYEDGLYWFCHPTVLPQFNNTNFPGWVANYDLQAYGRPIVVTGKCSTLATKGDLILFAPSLYVIGDRMQFEVAYSRHEPTAVLTNKTAFRGYSRVDGQLLTGAPITLADGNSQVAPAVVLN